MSGASGGAYRATALPPVAPVVVPRRYRATLALVAFAMVLLPLVYLSIVVLAALGVLAYMTVVWPQLRATLHGGGLVMVLAYGGPPAAGVVLVVFMLRSMWPRRRQTLSGEVLTEGAQPELHAWVRRIAEALRAPVPREIRVDLDANASAALRRGIWSLGSRDLTLTIGLPLVVCLDARQLAGVVAHELGHFAQRGGMGVSYVIRAVNLWFARVVHERGSFDEELHRRSATGHWLIRAVAGLSRLFVWVSRQVLAGLMRLGTALSGAMSRQMELDADRYAARLVGARTATDMLFELSVVQLAAQQSWGEVQHLWRERQLPNDVLSLIADHRRRVPPEVVAQLRARQTEQPDPSWYDTHPSDEARAANLLSEPGEGVYGDEQPARALFQAFEELCQRLSMTAYRAQIGEQLSRVRLIDSQAIETRRQSDERYEASLVRVFGPLDGPSRPLPLDLGHDSETLPLTTAAVAAEAGADPESRSVEAWEQLTRLQILTTFYAAGIELSPASRQEVVPDDMGLDAARAAARREVEKNEALLLALDAGRARRVERAFARAGAETRDEARRLAAALAVLDQAIPAARKAGDHLRDVRILAPFAAANERSDAFQGKINGGYAALLEQLGALRSVFKDQPNPLADHEHLATIEWTLFGHEPLADDPAATLDAAEEALMRWRLLRRKLLGRLAEMTEAIEAVESGRVVATPPPQPS